jgi:hypothetical protein
MTDPFAMFEQRVTRRLGDMLEDAKRAFAFSASDTKAAARGRSWQRA